MSGLTAQGFNRETYENEISDMQARAQTLYGNDVNLADNSPLGIFIKIIAFFLATDDTGNNQGLWELAQNVYDSGYIDTAEGVSLDGVVKNMGLKRLQAQPATGQQMQIIGTNGTVISSGFLISRQDGTQYETIDNVTITNGSGTSRYTAVNGGTNTNTPVGTITTITNPTAGVTSVTNLDAAVGGTDAETDDVLRQRYYNSISKVGASTANSIQATLLATLNVKAAIVRANNTMATDGNGTPAKAIAPIVYGGADADVANAILNTAPAGIQSFGTTNVSVTDLSGNPQTIGFTRPTVVEIYVKVHLTTDSNFPSNGQAQVTTQIINYIGGTDADGTYYAGLNLASNVIWSKCVAACQNVTGVDDVAVTLSTDNVNFSSANITISNLQVAKTDNTKVVFV